MAARMRLFLLPEGHAPLPLPTSRSQTVIMSDTGSSRHSYSTGGTSGAGSSAASDNSNADALNVLQDRGG